jgi:hypothetical protein
MNLKSIGNLIQDLNNYPLEKDWVSSNDVLIPFFDTIKLPIRIDYSDYEGDWKIDEIDLTLFNFLETKTNFELKEQVAEKSFENWKEYDEAVGYLDGIETYSSVKDRPEWMEKSLQNCLWLEKLTKPEKVWEYINPTEIIVTKDRYKEKEGVFIQILCDCDWEEEHGLQIILKNGNELIRVSDQDGNLFDYYDKNGNKIEE